MEVLKKSLENRIWNTKKSRMRTEKRFKALEKRNQILNIWYTVFLVVLSLNNFSNALLNLSPGTIKILDFLILASSIVALVFSMYTVTTRYGERANEMRICYTELGKLEFRVKSKDLSIKEINEINEEYQEILKKFENHQDIDYLEILECKPLNYYRLLIKEKVLSLLLYLIPFVLLIVAYLICNLIK